MGEDTNTLMLAILRIQALADHGLDPFVVSFFLNRVTALLILRSHSGGECWGNDDTTQLWVGSDPNMQLFDAD
jgi:hypothetical protein